MERQAEISVGATDNKDLKKARKLWNKTKDCKAEKKYRDILKSNLDYFVGNDQGWDKDGARGKLEEESRPALTLNRIAPIMRLICGARPRTEADFTPVEEGDLETAHVFSACKDHVDRVNQWEFEEDEIFKDGIIKNGAVVGIFPNYDKDVRGEISLPVYDRTEFYFDSDSKKKHRRDGKFCFRAPKLSPDEVKKLWPKHASKVDMLTGLADGAEGAEAVSRDSNEVDEYQDTAATYYDKAGEKLTIVYYWYKEDEKITKITDLGTNEVYDSQKSPEQVQKTLSTIPIGQERFKVSSTNYTRVKYMVFSHDILLEEGVSPWDREDGRKTILSENLPFLCFEPDRIVAGTRQELISLIEPLMDPQRYHNKLSSAILEILGTTAYSGWEYEKGAAEPKWADKLKKFGGKPGFIMEWAKGGLAKARKILPNPVPAGPMEMAKRFADDLLDISGTDSLVSTESLGKGASGKAIDLKQQQGGNIISWVYDSFRFFQYCLTEYIRDAIQVLYDYEKVVRIKGQGTMKPSYVRVNEAIYDEVGGIEQILHDVTVGQFDVGITEKQILPTMRIERFRIFADLVKTGALQLPPEVMTTITLELMDDPDLKEIVENELAEFMPPQMMGGGMPGAAAGGMA